MRREEEIRRFKSRDYWEIEGRFGVAAGEYPGRWFDEKFRKPEGDEHATAFRLWDKARAEAIRAKCAGKGWRLGCCLSSAAGFFGCCASISAASAARSASIAYSSRLFFSA